MAKAGVWKGYERAKAKSGNEYFKCTIEDENGNDRSYNVFDPGMREVAEKLDKGQKITYGVERKGAFWNLASLDGTGAAKQSSPKSESKGEVDWEQLGYEKALWGALNGALAGGLIKDLGHAVEWLGYFDTLYYGIKSHKYKMMKDTTKDGDIPF